MVVGEKPTLLGHTYDFFEEAESNLVVLDPAPEFAEQEVFGWGKVIGGMRKSRFIGRLKTSFATLMTSAVYNLIRMSRLAAA